MSDVYHSQRTTRAKRVLNFVPDEARRPAALRRPSRRAFRQPSGDPAAPLAIVVFRDETLPGHHGFAARGALERAYRSPHRAPPDAGVRRPGLPGQRRLHGPRQLGHRPGGRRRVSATGLLWVLVLSNLMAILLQTLAARLGIVAGRDLAQACRESYPQAGVQRAVGAVRDRHRRLRSGGSAGRGHRAATCCFGLAAGDRRAADRARYDPGAVAFALRHPVDRGADPVADRDHDRLLPGGACRSPSRSCTRCFPALSPRLNTPEPVRRRGDPGRDRDAAQSLSAFGAGADAPHRPHRRRQARSLPLQPGRFRAWR